jgi:4-methylaminobutanoate oxidase (formaldehyde-forming)
VGSVTSGALGHRVGASIAMGYVTLPVPVTQAALDAHAFAVEVAGRRVPARAQLAPYYDPTSARVRA